jgi:adenine-specific DNA-methyltransferase
MTSPLSARDLGARGSRGEVAGSDPAGAVSPEAAAVLASVPDWWAALATEAGLSGDWLDISVAIASPPPAVVYDAQPEPEFTKLSPEALGAAYVEALSPQVRARHGRHYTPQDLADNLWSMARRSMSLGPGAIRLPGLVRDRACGAGALLLPPLREHVRASTGTDAEVALAALPSLIEGIDADPNAVWLANAVLAVEALPLLAAVPPSRRRPFATLAHVGDGLAPCDRPARVEMQNPPYGRVRLTADEREHWNYVLYGHANLYGLFIAAALADLDEDGVLAALIPTSFTSGLYFSRLRETLSKSAPLREASFVVERNGTFTNVLQETCLVSFSRRRARRTAITSINGHVQAVARVKSPRGSRPWLLPRRADDAAVAAAAANFSLRLPDIGYQCSTGPLVWNRRKTDLISQIAPRSAPIIWAADIDGGSVHRDGFRDGMRYLMLHDNDEQVMILRDAAILIQRTTAPEQYRRLVVADLGATLLQDWGGRVVVENHVNVLRPTIQEPLLQREKLAIVLSTETIDRVMRSLAGSVAVSAYELESIPFPDAKVQSHWNSLSGHELIQAVADSYRM